MRDDEGLADDGSPLKDAETGPMLLNRLLLSAAFEFGVSFIFSEKRHNDSLYQY